jgi:cell division septum initiation protein DivIVA
MTDSEDIMDEETFKTEFAFTCSDCGTHVDGDDVHQFRDCVDNLKARVDELETELRNCAAAVATATVAYVAEYVEAACSYAVSRDADDIVAAIRKDTPRIVREYIRKQGGAS